MKTVIISIVLFLFATTAEAQFRSSITGSWYNPNEAGHGLAVEVLPNDQILIYWYTYDKQGDPMYVMGVGKSTDSHYVEIDAFRTEGMYFGDFDPNDQSNIPFGKIQFGVYSCDEGRFGWQSSEFGSGQTEMIRLTTTEHNACAEVAYAGVHNSSLYSDTFGDALIGISMVSPLGRYAFVTTTGTRSAVITGQIEGNYIQADAYLTSGGHIASGRFGISPMPDGYFMIDDGQPVGVSARMGAVSMHNNTWGDGTHTFDVDGARYTVTIKEGYVSGSGNNGCRIDGVAYQEDVDFDVTTWEVEVTNCGAFNGNYRGLGGTNVLIMENGYSGFIGTK